MKRTGQALSSRRMKIQNLKATHQIGQPALRSKQGGKKDLLLRHPNFVSSRRTLSFETPPLACETGVPQVKMDRTGCIGKRGTVDTVRWEMNPELGLQVYLTHFLTTPHSIFPL